MEVKLDKTYPLDVDAARAWAVLRDVRTVAGCMPGATLTEQVDDAHYRGSVKVKVGPASAAFAGDIEVLALDEAQRLLRLLGKGADRGGSSASMELTARVAPGEHQGGAVLVGQANVIVNGKFAQFGGRMMVQVSDMLLAQFVDNFRAAAAALPPAGAAAAAPADGTDPPAARVPPRPALPAEGTAPAPPQAPPAKANEINGLALLWGLVKGWFAGLTGRRT